MVGVSPQESESPGSSHGRLWAADIVAATPLYDANAMLRRGAGWPKSSSSLLQLQLLALGELGATPQEGDGQRRLWAPENLAPQPVAG